jgi:hypothetical protein
VLPPAAVPTPELLQRAMAGDAEAAKAVLKMAAEQEQAQTLELPPIQMTL